MQPFNSSIAASDAWGREFGSGLGTWLRERGPEILEAAQDSANLILAANVKAEEAVRRASTGAETGRRHTVASDRAIQKAGEWPVEHDARPESPIACRISGSQSPVGKGNKADTCSAVIAEPNIPDHDLLPQMRVLATFALLEKPCSIPLERGRR